MKQILSFLKELRSHNDREWFNAHKDEYLEVKARVEEIASEMIVRIAEFDPEASYLTPADCTYRIYRDTRFSHDKTPYKTHIGIFVNPPQGKKSWRLGYYLHLEPGNCLAGVGTIGLPSKMITAIRREIFDNVEEFIDIVDNPDFKNLYPTVGENPVKTVPKGFPKDWEHLDLIRPRDYFVSCGYTDAQVKGKDFISRMVENLRVAKPYKDFINFVIDENPELLEN